MTETFTADQLDAVDVSRRNEDACVVAGPGSGKTTVLVEYFRRLVEAGVDPLRILAITFTEKAAGNMRKKLAQAFQASPVTRARMERAWVSTVHGFCARLLRENAVFAGVDPEFYVADERESWRLQQQSMADAMDALFQEHPAELRALIRGLSSLEFEEAVLSAYDAMRGAGETVDKLAAFPVPPGPTVEEIAHTLRALRAERLTAWTYAQKEHLECAMGSAQRIVEAATPLEALHAVRDFSCSLNKCRRGNNAYTLVKQMRDQIGDAKYGLITRFYAGERKLLLEILHRFDARYRELKQQAGALDFADLEEFSVRLLEQNEAALTRLRAQFDHVLMDEFQDTNGQQARLLELVRIPGRFYAVGDINQSIFGFRHAEPEGFAGYRDRIENSGAHLVNLVDNFRSRADILSAVETVAEGRNGIVKRPLVAGRRFETPRACSVELLAAPDAPAEAQWVARRILELCPAEFAFQNVAVLVRNTEVIGEFTAALDQAGVPYLVNRGRGFYESREVNDLVHLLRAIANPRDEVSIATLLRSPLVEASDEALLRLRLRDRENIGTALMRLTADAADEFGAEDYAKLARIRDRLRGWRERREYVAFDRLLLEAMDDCGYRVPSGSRAAANIDKLLAQARAAAPRMSLDAFVDELSLVRASNPREPDAPPEDSADAVQVMTVHSAKGLEYPAVFVAAMQKGVESNPPVVAFSRRSGLGARWRNPAAREDKDDLFMHALRAEWKQREEHESDRLLYVAMTRAEEHLVLSYSGKPANWAKTVAESLHPDVPGLQERTAPDGREWTLRVLLPEGPPEPAPRPAGLAVEEIDAAELLDPPEIAGQEDGNTTVTALARFVKCPREYYLSQYLKFGVRRKKWDEDGEQELSATELGTQVHALLAGTPVPEPDEEAVRLAQVFRRGPIARRLLQATRIEREFDFLLAVEDLVIRGQVDLWFEQGGEICIVDYKTDNVTAAEAAQRSQDYALQLRLYGMAIEQVAGRPPARAWLHFLRPDTVVEVDLRPSLIDAPEQVVRDFQEAQSTLHFPLVEGPHCRRCQFYKTLCPARDVA
ncbi:MAG: UvrD-helicase domain-containing protein [Candidatus Sulfopaludibacter sp.]|nr:UvrD-helicase domain-containing protein [Candidatus Sulfopaludibacter sp.]